MWNLFLRGGPIMWPLLITSVGALSVVIERLIFITLTNRNRAPETVEKIFKAVEKGEMEKAIAVGSESTDFVARTLVYGLKHGGDSITNALLRASNQELKQYNRGLSVLDTVITLAPLLGLLGTVTGMIHAFGFLGNQELSAPTAITGGIAQALIATAFGLGIAITALIPFNYLNACLEEARHELEDSTSQLELVMRKRGEILSHQS